MIWKFRAFSKVMRDWHLWGRMEQKIMNATGDEDTVDLGPKKNFLVLYSSTNRKGRKDATGAFIPEAKAFAKFHEVPANHCVGIDLENIPPSARRAEVYRAIHESTYNRPLDVVAFYGHGWPDGIQFGFSRETVGELAAIFSRKCSKDVRVALYACLAAENDKRDKNRSEDDIGPGTDGGFADVLRDELVRHGITHGCVDAHKTRGHTTWNPFVVRFLCESVEDATYGGTGGAWLVQPGSTYWRQWCQALRSRRGTLRHEFPLLDELGVKLRLTGSIK